jgi:hypothetical protein
MKRITLLIVTILMFLSVAPYAHADFAATPTLDVTTSSTQAGATDAVYKIHIENTDSKMALASLSVVIPAGYSINSTYITSKSGITIITGTAGQPGGALSAPFNVKTTIQPGHFSTTVSAIIFTYHADMELTEPTPTAPGKMVFQIPSTIVGNAVYLDSECVAGFFINPSTAGTYTWGPSLATPASGSPVTTVARSGYTQTVTITGTPVPEFSSSWLIVTFAVLAVVVFARAHRKSEPE